MKHISALFILSLLFASCKKEASHFESNEYLQEVKAVLEDSVSPTDYSMLDFSRSVLSKVDSVDLYVLRIPFTNKAFENDFIVVNTNREGVIERGKIVHQEGDAVEVKITGGKKKAFNGSIMISSLDRMTIMSSPINNGFIVALHSRPLSRTAVVQPSDVMPEIVITYSLPSSGNATWSFWMNLQSYFDGGGGSSWGNYYGSYNPVTSGGGGSTGSPTSGGPSTTPPPGNGGGGLVIQEPILIDAETMDEDPAIDVQKFINCFNAIPDAGAICSIEIMTDIPVDANPNAIYDIDARSPGHTFLSISKSNGGQHVTQNIGFYPSSGYKSIAYAPVSSKVVDNSKHEFNASLRMPLTPERLKTALQAVLLYKDHSYDVDEYNCTDFALDVLNSVRGIGLSIPLYGVPGSPLTQATRTPGGLYNKLQQMVNSNDPEKANITIGFYKGYTNTSKGPCN